MPHRMRRGRLRHRQSLQVEFHRMAAAYTWLPAPSLDSSILDATLNAPVPSQAVLKPGILASPHPACRSSGHLHSYGTSSNCAPGKVTLVVVAYLRTWILCLWSYATRSEPAQVSAPRI